MKQIITLFTRKTGVDTEYIIKGGFWILIGHTLVILGTLITSYFFANYLDPQLYGNYRYMISASIIISLFSLSGIETAIVQAVAKNGAGYFRYAQLLSLKFGAITSVVSFATAIYYYLNGNDLLTIGFILIGVLQPLVNSSNLIYSYFYGIQKFNLSVAWYTLRTTITTIALVVTILLTENILFILLTFFLSNLIANLFPNFFCRIGSFGIVDKSTTAFTDLNNYAKHTSIQNIIIGIANQLDKILIFQFLGAKELAMYAFATAIPDQYKGVTKAIDSLLLPRFSKYTFGVIKSAVWRKTVLYFIFLMAGSLVYIWAAPLIFSILYPTYTDAILLSQIYALGIIFGFGSIPFTAIKSEMDNTLLYKYKIVLAVFQISLLILLMSLYGLIGAILARVVYRAFSCAYGYYLFFKRG